MPEQSTTESDHDTLFIRIQDQYSREEFAHEIKNIQHEFYDLIDEETGALCLLSREGRLPKDEITQTDLTDGSQATIQGRITRIDNLRTFKRKDGSSGRVISAYLDNENHSVRISFWENKDIEKVLNGDLKIGDRLSIINGKVKINNYGTTVNVGQYSIVKVNE